MPSTIAALPPSSRFVPPDADWDAGRDVPEYAFSELWQDSKQGFGFGDLLDIVNPLQHIPLVSSIYRMITGDEIGVGARLAGGALFGGPIGAVAASAVALLEGASGKTVEQHVAALFDGAAHAAPAASIAGDTPPVAGQAKAASEQSVPSDKIALGPPPVAEKPAPEPAPRAAVTPPAVRTTPSQPAPAATTERQTTTAATVERPTGAAATTERQPTPDAAAERQRIARAVEQARRAQAGLLLASIEADRAVSRQAPPDRAGEDGAAPASPSQPFRDHPYMLPPGAPPQAIGRAMEQALMRYQSMLRQRSGGGTAAAPRPIPAPVR